MKHENLSFKGVALGLGATLALILFFLGILSIYGWGTEVVHLLSSIHCGYAPTLSGTFLGTLSGFIDGALFGLIFVFFHNLAIKK